GFGREGFQPGQACPELRCRSFEHSATSESEQRIPDESDLGFRQMVCNVPQRVSAYIDDARAPAPQRDPIAIGNGSVDARDPRSVRFRRHDRTACGGLDRLIPACVIGMPMRVPDLGDPPAFRSGFAQIGVGVGRIDAGGLTARWIVQQETVVVGEARELVDLQAQLFLPRGWRGTLGGISIQSCRLCSNTDRDGTGKNGSASVPTVTPRIPGYLLARV